MTERIYLNSRPVLTIERVRSRTLGNCYYGTVYRITSLDRLGKKEILSLREAGLLGFGQEFTMNMIVDGSIRGKVPDKAQEAQPCGWDTVQSSEVNTLGEVLRSPGINPYTGSEDKPILMPYYVYECDVRVDSGD